MNISLSDKRMQEIKDIFTQYLESQYQRKTQERYRILEEIYLNEGHLTAEEIFQLLISKNFRVSKSTVYNTLEVLVSSGLVRKHQFGNHLTVFEKSVGSRQHDHLVCLDCHKLTEFCDPRIQLIQNMVGNVLHFDIHKHELLLYGHCTREHCANRQQLEQLETEKANADDVQTPV